MAVAAAQRPVGEAALWFGVGGGAGAWTLRLLISYPLVPFVCDRGAVGVLDAVTVVCALVAAAALLVSWRSWRRTRDDDRPQARRPRFMAVSGIMLDVVFLASIVTEGSMVHLQDPCIIPTLGTPRALTAPALLAAAGGWLTAAPAWAAHAPGTPAAELVAGVGLDAVVVAGLALAAGAYARGARALRRRRRGSRLASGWRSTAYAAAIATLLAALVSPLDALSAELFAAHMVQHLLLILVAAPLLVLSEPLVPLLWSLPPRARRALGRAWRRTRWVRGAWHGLTRPATAWVLHATAVWIWHAPPLYEAALAHAWVHAAEHLSFSLTAVLFWWAVARAPAPRGMGEGVAVLYLFTAMMQSAVLGAILTFAPSPWYTVHDAGAAAWGLSPLEDQQLAGVIMWAPAGLVYILAAALTFTHWLRTAEQRQPARPGTMPGPADRPLACTLPKRARPHDAAAR